MVPWGAFLISAALTFLHSFLENIFKINKLKKKPYYNCLIFFTKKEIRLVIDHKQID